MYIAALVYLALLAAPMVVAILNDRSYGGGNHWVLFGTTIDQFFQQIGATGLICLAIPPGIIAVIALLRSDILWGASLAVLTGVFTCLAYVFAIMVLD